MTCADVAIRAERAADVLVLSPLSVTPDRLPSGGKSGRGRSRVHLYRATIEP
jgi:hypothetical protein